MDRVAVIALTQSRQAAVMGEEVEADLLAAALQARRIAGRLAVQVALVAALGWGHPPLATDLRGVQAAMAVQG